MNNHSEKFNPEVPNFTLFKLSKPTPEAKARICEEFAKRNLPIEFEKNSSTISFSKYYCFKFFWDTMNCCEVGDYTVDYLFNGGYSLHYNVVDYIINISCCEHHNNAVRTVDKIPNCILNFLTKEWVEITKMLFPDMGYKVAYNTFCEVTGVSLCASPQAWTIFY